MEITLIRHGKTPGNLARQYIGSTDQDLAPEGIEEILRYKSMNIYPAASMVFSSPLRRCVQTARLIFPESDIRTVPGLRECAFGDFEEKTHDELTENADYRKFLESGGRFKFPGGDDSDQFTQRCADAFSQIVDELVASDVQNAAIVCHGGTIMSIMWRFCHRPSRDYFDWQTGNGQGCVIRPSGGGVELIREITIKQGVI